MSTNKTCKPALAVLLFALAACANPSIPSGETIPAGMGLGRIHLGGGSGGRTVLPDNIGEYYYILRFTDTAGVKADVERSLTGGLALTVPLEPAEWFLEVRGYTSSGTDALTLRVTGSAKASITAEAVSDFPVTLTPVFIPGRRGILNYSIGLSLLPSVSYRMARFNLAPLEAQGASEEIDISGFAGGTATGSRDLPEGSYWVVIDLYDGLQNRAAVLTKAVHIYDGLTTNLNHIFTDDDFVQYPSLTVTENTLRAKLDAALASPEAACTINLDDETDLTSFSPYGLSKLSGSKTITIRGNGKTVQLAGVGSLFSIGSGVKLVLYDLTLRGISTNTDPLVQVNSGGTLEMKFGSLITGNTATTPLYYSTYHGGGVHVENGGTFSMSSGVITGNTVRTATNGSQYGAGVYVAGGGTFTMSGGEIWDNTASDDDPSLPVAGGGGVYVNGGGIFTMSGGTIRDNHISGPSKFGKEVVVTATGTFIISGNARPERVFLYFNSNSHYPPITIVGPLSGGIVTIDLAINDDPGLGGLEDKKVLRLDDSYRGDLAALKTYFSLGNGVKVTSHSDLYDYVKISITGYTIDNNGIIRKN
jgi:hypothetical protein